MDYKKIFKDRVYIKNASMLEQYINFCISENEVDLIEGENHHILPSSLFPEYSDLRMNIQNKTRLTYENHLRAHYLLILSIDSEEMFYAFNMMNNFYNENNIANLEEYNKLKQNFKTMLKNSKWCKSSLGKRWIYKDGEYKFIKDDLDGYIKNGWVYKGNVSNTVWVNNGIISKRIDRSKISEGFIEGRLETVSKGKDIWMNKDKKNKRVDKNQVKLFLENGWIEGSWAHSTKNMKRISKRGINKSVSRDKVKEFQDNGWVLGAYKVSCDYCYKEVSSLGKHNHKCKTKEDIYTFSTILS